MVTTTTVIIIIVIAFYLETEFYYVGLVDREITMNIRLTINLWVSFVSASHKLKLQFFNHFFLLLIHSLLSNQSSKFKSIKIDIFQSHLAQKCVKTSVLAHALDMQISQFLPVQHQQDVVASPPTLFSSELLWWFPCNYIWIFGFHCLGKNRRHDLVGEGLSLGVNFEI